MATSQLRCTSLLGIQPCKSPATLQLDRLNFAVAALLGGLLVPQLAGKSWKSMGLSINGDTPKWFVYKGKTVKTPSQWMIWIDDWG